MTTLYSLNVTGGGHTVLRVPLCDHTVQCHSLVTENAQCDSTVLHGPVCNHSEHTHANLKGHLLARNAHHWFLSSSPPSSSPLTGVSGLRALILLPASLALPSKSPDYDGSDDDHHHYYNDHHDNDDDEPDVESKAFALWALLNQALFIPSSSFQTMRGMMMTMGGAPALKGMAVDELDDNG